MRQRILLISLGAALLAGLTYCHNGLSRSANRSALAPKAAELYTYKQLRYDSRYDDLLHPRFRLPTPVISAAEAREAAIRWQLGRLYKEDASKWIDDLSQTSSGGRPISEFTPDKERLFFPDAAAHHAHVIRNLDSLAALAALPFPTPSAALLLSQQEQREFSSAATSHKDCEDALLSSSGSFQGKPLPDLLVMACYRVRADNKTIVQNEGIRFTVHPNGPAYARIEVEKKPEFARFNGNTLVFKLRARAAFGTWEALEKSNQTEWVIELGKEAKQKGISADAGDQVTLDPAKPIDYVNFYISGTLHPAGKPVLNLDFQLRD